MLQEPGFSERLAARLAARPIAWRVIGEGGVPVTDWIDGDGAGEVASSTIGGKWIQYAYRGPQPPKEIGK